MSSCLQCICCCFFTSQPPQSTRRPTRSQNKPKIQKPKPKPSRLVTKFRKQQTINVTKQQKRMGKLSYCCPICTLLFNKILACQDCENNICLKCFQSYQNKYLTSNDNMKCPFCSSQKSNFIDFQKEAHSYFDTTNNGFLSASQRKKVDQQIGNQSDSNSPKKTQSKMLNQNIKLDQIREQENQNGPFNSHEGLLDNSSNTIVRQQNTLSIVIQNVEQNQNNDNRIQLVQSKQQVPKSQEKAIDLVKVNSYRNENERE